MDNHPTQSEVEWMYQQTGIAIGDINLPDDDEFPEVPRASTLVYGIRKDASNYALLAVSGPNDTRAGHDHLRAIVPVPCTVHDAKAALDAAYDAGTGLECRREDGVFVVEFFRPLVMEPLAAEQARARRIEAYALEAAR